MGPIHTRAGRDELLAQIEDSGGEVLTGGGTGGHEKGFFLEPAVIAEPRADSRVMREEVFGPVLPVLRYSDFDDVDRAAPTTRRTAWARSIWTHDVRKIHRARARHRRRHDVGQPDPLRLRRAAVRRDQGLRLRQGARPRGARLLRGAEERGGRWTQRNVAQRSSLATTGGRNTDIRQPRRRGSSSAARCPPGDPDAAVQRAHAAFAEWARLGYADRGKVLHACAEAFEAHVDELTPILVAEQGKTIREAKIELHKAADTLEHYAGLARQVRGVAVHGARPRRRRARAAPAARRRGRDRAVELPDDAAVQQARPGAAVRQHGRRQARRHDAADDAAARPRSSPRPGCRRACSTSSRARGAVAGEALVTHPLVRKVAFTGSTPVGERVAALAAKGSKRVTLELGGSDPMIICDDADLAAAASAGEHGPLLQLRPGVPGDQARLRVRRRSPTR